MRHKDVIIVGGGAAGFFAALSCKAHHSDADVDILEASGKTLSKVKVSGGGRCNVTNACASKAEFLKHYPRGSKHLKKTFSKFDRDDTIAWFAQRGVALKAEPDGRMFPVTDDSQTIIDCLRWEAGDLGVNILQKQRVESMENKEGVFHLQINGRSHTYDRVIVASGGSPKPDSYDWLRTLGHNIIPPVPSLFTFNVADEEKLKDLSGVSVPLATVKIQGSKLQESGPVLVTHWGLSGPAVLKLSAWGARQLHESNYTFTVLVNWTPLENEEQVRTQLTQEWQNTEKKIQNANPFDISKRFWSYLLDRVEINPDKRCHELSKKEKNRLVNVLCNDNYVVRGKTTFKEEFVTCGGVDLAEVDFNTMASRKVAGLYFAGEVLDIDGITGGFNFQSAWSTGFVAGQLA